MTNIPFEVQKQIFYFIEKEQDITQCQLVCKKWCQAATELLYESIYIDTESDLLLLVNTLRRNSSQQYGNLVKTVRISYYINTEALAASFALLFEYCPNIEKLKGPVYRLWPMMKAAANNGQLKQSQYESDHFSSDDVDNWIDIALTFKKKLKSLHLGDIGSKFTTYRAISSRLDGFPSLTHLSI